MNNSLDGAISEVSGLYFPIDGDELVELWGEWIANENEEFPRLSDFQREQLRDLPESVVDQFMVGWVDVRH